MEALGPEPHKLLLLLLRYVEQQRNVSQEARFAAIWLRRVYGDTESTDQAAKRLREGWASHGGGMRSEPL